MKRFTSILTGFVMLLLVACSGHQLNIGGSPQRLTITPSEPIGLGKDAPLLAGGQQARFTADVYGVNGPFYITWNLGGAAENTFSTLAAAGTSTVEVDMHVISGQQSYTASATVTDSEGETQTDSIDFQLLGWHNDPPEIEDVTLNPDSSLLTVTASDIDGDELSFSLRNALNDEDLGPPDTVVGYVAVWDLSAGLATSPNDILAGGNASIGGFIATVTDEYGASVESEQIGGNFEVIPLEDDNP